VIVGRWWVAYGAALGVSTVLAYATSWGSNVSFVAGALTILVSVGFIGFGGDRRFRIIRNIVGVPVSKEAVDPMKRKEQVSTGIRVFLLGSVIWLPLLLRAFW
jgi:hypothetical protein